MLSKTSNTGFDATKTSKTWQKIHSLKGVKVGVNTNLKCKQKGGIASLFNNKMSKKDSLSYVLPYKEYLNDSLRQEYLFYTWVEGTMTHLTLRNNSKTEVEMEPTIIWSLDNESAYRLVPWVLYKNFAPTPYLRPCS